MGACFHIEGVECDNCRGSRPYYPAPPFHTTTGTGLTMQPYVVDNLKAAIDELRRELADFKARYRREMTDLSKIIGNLVGRIENIEAKKDAKPKKAAKKPARRRSR